MRALVVFAALVVAAPSPAAHAAPLAAFAEVPTALAAPVPGEQGFATEPMTIEIGRGRVRLGKGMLLPVAPLGGRTWAAAFRGPVTFEYAPQLAVERGELRRSSGAESLGVMKSAALLVGCEAALAAGLAGRAPVDARTFGKETPAPLFAVFAKDFARLHGDHRTGLVRSLLGGVEDGYALAIGFDADKPAIEIELDPGTHESSSLAVKPKDDDDLLLCSQEALGPPGPGVRPGGGRPSFVAEHVTVDATIGDDLGYRGATTILARMHVAGPVWAPFDLSSELIVDSVLVDGAPAPSGRIEKSSTLWVRLPEGLDRGMACEIRIVAHGKVLERDRDWIALESSLDWLPRHDPFQRATYDLTFRSPRAYRLVSVGDCVASETGKDAVTTRWALTRPSRNATFVIGPFDETRLDDPRLPSLTVLMSKSMQREVRDVFGEDEVGGDLSKQAVADLANAENFYRKMLGDPPDTTIVAAEIPYLHGESFPGLVNLSWATFSDVTDRDLPRHVRAHEMAHQWWPNGVEFASYRDQWLSEGMSDFCALWFQQVSTGNPRGYFERLDAWRRDLVPRRWRAAGNPEEASALALGWRIRAERGSGAREAVLYHKGAWVVHMLRGLMLDPRTARDDRFAAFLRETYRTYRGRSVSTEEVRAVAEKHAGEDLGWFFRQWVEGTAIPSYRWAWRKEKLPSGAWKVDVRVAAAEVPEDFRMPVPLRLDLGEGRGVRLRVDVVGAKGEATIEGIEFEPKAIEFNEHAGVLCEAKEEPW